MIAIFFKDSAKYLFVKVAISLVGIAGLKIYTANLSPVEFGVYSVTISILAYSAILAISWLSASVLRFYHLDKSNSLSYRSSIFYLSKYSILIVGALLLTLLLYLSKSGFYKNNQYFPFVIVLLFVSSAIIGLYLAFLRAARQLNRYSYLYIFQLLTSFLIGSILLLWFDTGIVGIFVGIVLVNIFIIFLLGFKFRKMGWLLAAPKGVLTPEIFAYGVPIIFINIFTQALISSDQLMLKFFGKHDDVGMYAANYILAENSILAISSLFGSAFIPLVYSTWEKKGDIETAKFLRKVLLIFVSLTVPIAFLFITFFDLISNFVIDKDFHGGALIIPYVVFGAIFLGVGNIVSEILAIHKNTKMLMYCYASAAILNIILNFFYIPEYGMLGAAIITMISYFVLMLLILLASLRYMNIFMRADL